MEEYLENLKSFRSYIKDAEDETSKRSAEEQRQRTAIETLENDLNLVRSEVAKVSAETGEMVKEKNKVEWEITEKQKKIISLETECSTLKQEWINKHKMSRQGELLLQGEESPCKKSHVEGGYGFANEGKSKETQTQNCEKEKGFKLQMELTKQKMEALEAKRSALVSETLQNRELLNQEKQLMEAMPHNLAEMELNALEEEQRALSSDKAGEVEYIQSLQDRINVLKEVSCGVTCNCGVHYEVSLKRGS
ncbi:tropomyosin isoform X3 [Carex rostrata]